MWRETEHNSPTQTQDCMEKNTKAASEGTTANIALIISLGRMERR